MTVNAKNGDLTLVLEVHVEDASFFFIRVPYIL